MQEQNLKWKCSITSTLVRASQRLNCSPSAMPLPFLASLLNASDMLLHDVAHVTIFCNAAKSINGNHKALAPKEAQRLYASICFNSFIASANAWSKDIKSCSFEEKSQTLHPCWWQMFKQVLYNNDSQLPKAAETWLSLQIYKLIQYDTTIATLCFANQLMLPCHECCKKAGCRRTCRQPNILRRARRP